MIDPRVSIIEHRLRRVSRIITFASGKGGVGKSCCSSTAALLLARQGRKVGLLDLDLHGASAHIILGIEPSLPDEKGGILPLEAAYGLRYMGITPFTGERGVALRGDAVTNAIRELLAVVIWDDLDVLVVDMPPGIGEAVLDVARYVPRIEVVLVATPSTLSLRVMERLADVLVAGRIQPHGCILNMVRDGETARRPIDLKQGLRLLGEIPLTPDIEDELGQPQRLVSGRFAAALEPILDTLIPST